MERETVGYTVRMWRVVPCGLLAGCLLPSPIETDTAGLSGGGEWTGAGSLSDRDMVLDWWWDSSWESGACVKMLLYNNGASVSALQANVSLRGEIDAWIGGYGGADVTFEGPGQVSISTDSGLAAGGVLEAVYCAEPLTEPEDLVIFSVAGSPDDTGSDDTPVEDPPISGTVYSADRDWGLSYQGGAEHGSTSAECLLLKFWNFSGRDADGWSATIEFDGPTEVAYKWSLTVFDEDDGGGFAAMTLYPETPITSIEAGGSVEAGLCLEPMAAPVVFSVTAE